MSNYIEDLHEKRMRVWHEAKELLNRAADAKRDLTPAEDTTYTRLNEDIDALDERISQHMEQERKSMRAQNEFNKILAQPVMHGHEARGSNWLPSIAEYRGMQYEQRAIGTTGAFIPVEYSNTYFDLLRKRTAVLAAGPVLIPVDEAGSLVVPKVSSSVSISGLAENTAITPADPGLDSITLDPKKFGALTLVAREAVEDSRPELRQVIANSLIRDTAVELDKQLVTGSGAGQNLTGLRNVSGVTAGASTGVNGGALSFAFLADTLAAYDGANADPDRAAWIMHARTWSSVRKLVDSQQRPIVSIDPTQGVQPTLWGKPVFISNSLSITETVGTSTDCSSIILADMSQVVVAVARRVELLMSEHFAFDSDQVAIRVTCRYDVGVPQPTAVTVTTGVRP